jgi:hypothetical protein
VGPRRLAAEGREKLGVGAERTKRVGLRLTLELPP